MPRELTQAIVEQWVSLATGTFNVRDIWAEIGIESTQGKHHLRIILQRLEEKGIVKPLSKDGAYRRVDSDAKPIEWQTANPGKFLPLVLPFGSENWVRFIPSLLSLLPEPSRLARRRYFIIW
jgi:hypothetical protein